MPGFGMRTRGCSPPSAKALRNRDQQRRHGEQTQAAASVAISHTSPWLSLRTARAWWREPSRVRYMLEIGEAQYIGKRYTSFARVHLSRLLSCQFASHRWTACACSCEGVLRSIKSQWWVSVVGSQRARTRWKREMREARLEEGEEGGRKPHMNEGKLALKPQSITLATSSTPSIPPSVLRPQPLLRFSAPQTAVPLSAAPHRRATPVPADVAWVRLRSSSSASAHRIRAAGEYGCTRPAPWRYKYASPRPRRFHRPPHPRPPSDPCLRPADAKAPHQTAWPARTSVSSSAEALGDRRRSAAAGNLAHIAPSYLPSTAPHPPTTCARDRSEVKKGTCLPSFTPVPLRASRLPLRRGKRVHGLAAYASIHHRPHPSHSATPRTSPRYIAKQSIGATRSSTSRSSCKICKRRASGEKQRRVSGKRCWTTRSTTSIIWPRT
ncbi:hypothetical protein C8R47DRAFT_1129938 [Mycena vitilis]|nr:hypothetical protein C8R47DRAFT_1129938 [Mycena vitilis]